MKKTILTLVALGAVSSVMAQGIINFSTRVSGVVIGHVYGVGDATRLSGNTAAETPQGTNTYAGAMLTGTGFSAQLFGGALGTLEDALVAIGAPSAFRTGSLSGTPAPQQLVVPGVPFGGTGTFQVRAWDNSGGTLTSWDQAKTAWDAGLSVAGKSAMFTVSGLGDGGLNTPADMANFRSFNLYAVPEPATFLLAGLGAASLLIFRRRK